VRAVLQRVAWARVDVGGERIAAIGAGLLALVGVAGGDATEDAVVLAAKTARLRIFPEGERPFHLPVTGLPGGAVLCVSQFTLLADVRRGNRPSWAGAAPPEDAEPLVEAYAAALEAQGVPVARGRFAAHMRVSLENDGPVTIVLDSAELRAPRRARGARPPDAA
jgi:D-tyrosyl-tRNA(Tyr) deacylase